MQDNDPNASGRKRDHIELAFRSQVAEIDNRFWYEPLLSAHPAEGSWPPMQFLGKTFRAPLWVSSMTGGTEMARTINRNLARACKEFGFGMGLGSCRPILFGNEQLPDFDMRDIIGDENALYANLGIAQLEALIEQNKLHLAVELVKKLRADGLIIHVNPLQEWLQPEGDRFKAPPLDTIKRVLDTGLSVIVKEVGQGMGKASLEALFQLPLAAIDFAAAGGTNFAMLELLRGDESKKELYSSVASVGHTAEDMVRISNEILREQASFIACKQVIISGGVRDFLDGYYLTERLQFPAVYGKASAFLRHAQGGYDELHQYVEGQVRGLEMARAFLRVRG